MQIMQKLFTQLNSNYQKFLNIFNEIRFSHEWTIEKFDSFLEPSHPWKWPLYSESFTPLDSGQLQFHFRLHSNNGSNGQIRDYLSIDVVITEQQPQDKIKLKCEVNILILDQNRDVCYAKFGKFKVEPNCAQTFENYIKQSDLLNYRSAYLHNNELKLRFEIKLLSREESFTNHVQSSKYLPVGKSRIGETAKVTHLEYKWTIANCDSLFSLDFDSNDRLEKKKQPVVPLFIQSDYLSNDQHKLKLKLYPKGLNYEDNSEFVDIELCTDSLKMDFLVYAKIEIVGTGKLAQESNGPICEGKTILFRNYIRQNDLINLVKSQRHCIVSCKFTYMTFDESGFKEENIKTEHQCQLDATKTLSYYTQKSYVITKFININDLQQTLDKFPLETEMNQTFWIDTKFSSNSDWFSVRLTLYATYDTVLPGTIQFCVSLLDQFEQKCYAKETQVNSLSCKESFGYDKFIRKAHLNHLKANLLSNDKQITKLLIEFWVNTTAPNSSSENDELTFTYPKNGHSSVKITLKNSIYNHNSKFDVNGDVSLKQLTTASENQAITSF